MLSILVWLLETYSELEICIQKVYWGVCSKTTPMREWGKQCIWDKGFSKYTTGISGAGVVLYSCSESRQRGLAFVHTHGWVTVCGLPRGKRGELDCHHLCPWGQLLERPELWTLCNQSVSSWQCVCLIPEGWIWKAPHSMYIHIHIHNNIHIYNTHIYIHTHTDKHTYTHICTHSALVLLNIVPWPHPVPSLIFLFKYRVSQERS